MLTDHTTSRTVAAPRARLTAGCVSIAVLLASGSACVVSESEDPIVSPDGEADLPFASSSLAVPYFGYYFASYPAPGVQGSAAEVAGHANLVFVVEGEPVEDPAFARPFLDHGIQIIVQYGVTQEELMDPAQLDARLRALHARLSASGLLSRVVGLQNVEEWYLAWDRTLSWLPLLQAYQDGQVSALRSTGMSAEAARAEAVFRTKDLFRGYLERVHDRQKAIFPGVYSVMTDFYWTDERRFGPWYYSPPPRNTDVLAIDTYLINAAGCNRAEFDTAGLGRTVPYAAARFGKPIIIIGQAFHEQVANATWSQRPSSCLLEMTYELARREPNVVALTWFTYISGNGLVGVSAMPDVKAHLFAMYERSRVDQ